MNRIVVTDANILINLIHIGRPNLLGQLTGFEFVVPLEVMEEITEPQQAAALASALENGFITHEALTEIPAISLYAELIQTLGKGEAACLSLAVTKGWIIASDERRKFRREVLARLGPDRLLNTPGLLILAIRSGVPSVAEADKTLEVLAKNQFKVNFKSFRDLLEEPWH